MKEQKNNRPKLTVNKRIIFSVVFLVFGFILAFSFSSANQNNKSEKDQQATSYFEQEEKYRNELIAQKERNKELLEELEKKENKIQSIESDLAGSKDSSDELIQEAENLRLLLGDIPAEGKGVKVVLSDSEYDPSNDQSNPNDYIVHESQVFKVINELKISGAEAISINGKRIREHSYIVCTGPVIAVDGEQFPAPFQIEAIGDPEVLLASLNLQGGVVDQLVNDNIVVTTEEVNRVQMPQL